MCGINGLYAYNLTASLPSEAELLATRDHMRARGPDGSGAWWNADRRLGLGHRRLSIQDLSDRASQPMHSADSRYVVTFNGEIYNYPALRDELRAKGVVFRTTSDTEVLLHLYQFEGQQMVHRLRGMFAFAIWDNIERSLFLARDPYGIKPLYTANDGWTFRFASQVKALLAGGKVSRDPEPAGIVGFHIWGSVPEPFTLYREIRCLPAGHTQYIDAAGARLPQAYASVASVLAQGARQPVRGDAARSLVREAVSESVRLHLLADVDVGLFLSSGIDSCALLGLMRDAGQQRIKAVTLAFDEFRGTNEDESPLAAEMARQYNAEHIIRHVNEAEFRADLPAILAAMDQPSIDGVNTWFVAKAASEAGLKVALSGLGGDELLAGYPSFRQVPKAARWLAPLRALPGLGMGARKLLQHSGWFNRRPKALGLLEFGGTYAGAYLLRRALFLPFELKLQLDSETLALGLKRLKPLQSVVKQALTPSAMPGISRVAAMESCLYMRNTLLRDSDWAGMAHGLEIRTPLVDFELLHRLAPAVAGFTGHSGKAALASAPQLALPLAIAQRPKTGFGVPTGHWGSNAAAAKGRPSKGNASRTWSAEVYARTTDPLPLPQPDSSLALAVAA